MINSPCSTGEQFAIGTEKILRDMLVAVKSRGDEDLSDLVNERFLVSAIKTDRLFDQTHVGPMHLSPFAELAALEIKHIAESLDVSSTNDRTIRKYTRDVLNISGFGAV
jgi:hypothetical protein